MRDKMLDCERVYILSSTENPFIKIIHDGLSWFLWHDDIDFLPDGRKWFPLTEEEAENIIRNDITDIKQIMSLILHIGPSLERL